MRDSLAAYFLRSCETSFPLGCGCAWVGRKGEAGRPADVSLLQLAFEQGFRYFDTAPAYAESELSVGKFVETIDRDSIFLATKISLRGEFSLADEIHMSVDRSLKRLRTERLDLVQIHDIDTLDILQGADAGQSLLRAVESLREAGKIRHFGLATRNLQTLQEGASNGWFDSILTYSDLTPIDPKAKNLAAHASAVGVTVINGSPLAGLLFGTDPSKIAVEPAREERKRRAMHAYAFCKERGVSLLNAALQYPLTNPNVDITLTGPGTPSELESSIAALAKPLPETFWEDWNRELAQKAFLEI